MKIEHCDFEHFASDIKGWDVDFKQLSKDPFSSQLQQTVIGDLLITHACFSTRLEQRGRAPADMWTFALLDFASPDIIWRGQGFSQHIAVYAPGSEIDAYSPPGFKVFTFSIPEEVIDRWLQLYKLSKQKSLPATGKLLPIEVNELRQIQISAHRILTAAETPQVKEAEEIFLTQLLSTLWTDDPYPENDTGPHNYQKFKKLIQYVDENLGNGILLSDLCRVGDMSPRTVQRNFRHFIDDTPKKYIRSRRLNNVRKELIEKSKGSGYISDIANKWGFWHIGQFASDYRQLFGELPSETMRKA